MRERGSLKIAHHVDFFCIYTPWRCSCETDLSTLTSRLNRTREIVHIRIEKIAAKSAKIYRI